MSEYFVLVKQHDNMFYSATTFPSGGIVKCSLLTLATVQSYLLRVIEIANTPVCCLIMSYKSLVPHMTSCCHPCLHFNTALQHQPPEVCQAFQEHPRIFDTCHHRHLTHTLPIVLLQFLAYFLRAYDLPSLNVTNSV